MSLHIRSAQPEDASQLTAISHDAKRHWGYPEELMRMWRDDLTVTEEFIRNHIVYVAEDDSAIRGFYALSGGGATYELEHMWVEPGFMGRGVGRALLEHASGFLRAEGCTLLRIVSDPNAEGFYRRLGAVPAGRVPSRPEGRTLPLLELHLS